MTLTLEITDSSEANPRDATRHVFGEDGGTIGRAAGNSWVLTHNKVSGQHAQITFRSGVFYILDTSRNGVSVNSLGNPLQKGRPYALKPGDRIFIEPYEIAVWIDTASERAARSPRVDPFDDSDPFGPRSVQPVSGRHGDPLLPTPVSDIVDPLEFFDPVGRPGRKSEPPPPMTDDLLSAHYQPPAIVHSPAPPLVPSDPLTIPQDYDPLRPDEPEPPPPPPSPPIRPRPGISSEARRKIRETPAPAPDSTVRQPVPPPLPAPAPPPVASIPSPPAAPPLPSAAPPPPSTAPPVEAVPRPTGATADLAELLAGAGVPDAAITPELSRNLGQILRIVVSGLMDVLKSRQRIKEEFRMQQTMFRPIDNNPLKFSANLDDALHNLLVKRNVAYLNPVDAFADAFDDLRDHQLAMLAGMRVAFESMLAEFDADHLQGEFDAQMGKHSLPLMPAKMRYWDLYRERRQDLVKDPEATFARLFGEEFSRAYEEQFRKLKATRRARRQSPDGQPPVE